MAHRGRPRRIIPARAGFTGPPAARRAEIWDHPRSRGVYMRTIPTPRCTQGSSPLARGLPLIAAAAEDLDGIIPARAGFTGGRGGWPSGPSDHPRSRGVYEHLPLLRLPHIGSSPLARGLPPDSPRGPGESGIIPARAGFTGGRGGWTSFPSDHPRSRGVYRGEFDGQAAPDGSSPLARGLRQLGGLDVDGPRIIPARAGFTSVTVPRGSASADHPRSRGVYSPPTPPNPGGVGSSPLARGLRFS